MGFFVFLVVWVLGVLFFFFFVFLVVWFFFFFFFFVCVFGCLGFGVLLCLGGFFGLGLGCLGLVWCVRFVELGWAGDLGWVDVGRWFLLNFLGF